MSFQNAATSLVVALLFAGGVCEIAIAQDQATEPRTRAEILRRAREAKQGELEPYVISTAERRVRFLETWRLPRRLFTKGFGGFRPVLGGMPSGSGLAAGGGYLAGYNSELLQFSANARYSTLGYQLYDAGLVLFPRTNSLLPIEGYARTTLKDFTAIEFFGLGGDTGQDDDVTYALDELSFETGLTGRVSRFAELGAELQWLRGDTSTGSDDSREVDQLGLINTQGFGIETDFLVYGGRAVLHLRDQRTLPSVGVTLALEARRYDDRSTDAFDFTRVVGDLQAHIPLGPRNRILALHARTSHSVGEDGGVVPFYLMETLGGANSIRGFSEYRFRDTRNLLLNVEYRWEVWTYADFAFFYDAGKVFSDANDLDFRNLKSGYGFGLRGHSPGGMVFRFDLARSNEGYVLHIGSGPSF